MRFILIIAFTIMTLFTNSCSLYVKNPLKFISIYKNMDYMSPINEKAKTELKNNNFTRNDNSTIIKRNYKINNFSDNSIYPMTEKIYNFYKELVYKYINGGWVTIWSWIKNGKFETYPVITDKLWAQGFYGIFLALDYRKTNSQQTKILMENFVDSIFLMINKTKGIFLRDNTEETYKKYFNKNITSLEASKDQMIGLVTALFMIYYYLDDFKDFILKQKIKKLFNFLNNYFNKYYYILYNPVQNRLYRSAWYLQLHYYGFKYAFDYVLGKNRNVNLTSERLNLELSGFMKFKILLYRKQIITKKLKILGIISPWKTPFLKKLQMFNPEEYNINLKFFEYTIVATVSKKEALKILKILDNEEVKRLKHLNLAALYLYIIKKWKIKGHNEKYYRKVLKRDIYYYPENIAPNSEEIGSYWIKSKLNFKSNYLFDPVNHRCVDRTFDLKFKKDWDLPPPQTDKNMNYLIKLSFEKKIDIFNGLFLLTRYNLYSY